MHHAFSCVMFRRLSAGDEVATLFGFAGKVVSNVVVVASKPVTLLQSGAQLISSPLV